MSCSFCFQALDQLAEIRGAETLFLHVDVNNSVALALYERCGYHRVPPEDYVYYEFTKSLNLHDGATKGRNHFLLCKDLTQPIWLPMDESQREQQRNALGFEIP
jgi:RimJ/RimL family protein N-acetyltransferase